MGLGDRGMTPLDRLRDHYDHVDMTCPECGYEDADGEWVSETDGSQIRYQHICPSCGKVQHRTITLKE